MSLDSLKQTAHSPLTSAAWHSLLANQAHAEVFACAFTGSQKFKTHSWEACHNLTYLAYRNRACLHPYLAYQQLEEQVVLEAGAEHTCSAHITSLTGQHCIYMMLYIHQKPCLHLQIPIIYNKIIVEA